MVILELAGLIIGCKVFHERLSLGLILKVIYGLRLMVSIMWFGMNWFG